MPQTFARPNAFLTQFRHLRARMRPSTAQRYYYSRLDDTEDLEMYHPGGLHPVSIGDVIGSGQYKVLHKLGFGGSSTVWLAQSLRERFKGLVALKVMSAEQSSKPRAGIADLYIPPEVDKFSRIIHHPGKAELRLILDHFTLEGPNGTHLCLISQLAGPSVLSMAESPGRVSGSRRLRGDLARKVASQVATAVELLHGRGIIHGGLTCQSAQLNYWRPNRVYLNICTDLTSSNILFQLSDELRQWSTGDVYRILGSPEMEDVVNRDGSPAGPFAPSQVVAPIDITRLSSPSLLKEDIVLIDFGQSFFADHPPPNYAPATPLHYLCPEAFFESRTSFASDIWALGCTIFEIRAGSPLFDPFLGSDTLILKQIVEVLGKLPEPWWSSWEARQSWFDDETGEPKPAEEQRKDGVLLPALKSSLHQKLREIGEQDDAPDVDGGRMIEKTGTRLDEAEVELLADLLENMLRYRPEDRISIAEVVRHPWFDTLDRF
jgi:serine/threonine-protein kinase SRPK3